MPSKLITPSRSNRGQTTIGFVNLGCSKNQVDSEIMLGLLVADGFALTDDPKKAEVVIINTCGFIEEAKQESIDTIIAHGKLKESGSCRVLIAAGCLAQRYQGDLLEQLPELDGGQRPRSRRRRQRQILRPPAGCLVLPQTSQTDSREPLFPRPGSSVFSV